MLHEQEKRGEVGSDTHTSAINSKHIHGILTKS